MDNNSRILFFFNVFLIQTISTINFSFILIKNKYKNQYTQIKLDLRFTLFNCIRRKIIISPYTRLQINCIFFLNLNLAFLLN